MWLGKVVGTSLLEFPEAEAQESLNIILKMITR
jgi:hypothetical protein